jgi:hypothetical protein
MVDLQADHILGWFLELEERLVDILGYVPLSEETKGVSLPRISGVILEAGSLVDTVFRETMVTNKRLDDLTMRDFHPHFEAKLALSTLRSVLFVWPPRYLTPFAPWSMATSKCEAKLGWWDAYTGLKHSRIGALGEATLSRGVEVVAALHQVMSQTACFWRPLLMRDMVTSTGLHIANFITNIEGLEPSRILTNDRMPTVTVESVLFCTTLGGSRFPEHVSELESSNVACCAGKRLQRFLGLR